MIAEKMIPFVQNNSAIRTMFEEGNRLKKKYGADKVFDFSLGNPSVPAPDCVREAIIDLVNSEEPAVLHGYMNNAGFEDVREVIAQSLNRRFGTSFSAKNLIMTVGAASGLNVILKTILNPGCKRSDCTVFKPSFWNFFFCKESDHDSRRCKRAECDFENNPESRGGSDCFCTVFSGIWSICEKL